MNYEQMTIISNWDGSISTQYGRSKKARLEWRASGLEIYLCGRFPPEVYARAANLAINECLARNIPTISLRKVTNGD